MFNSIECVLMLIFLPTKIQSTIWKGKQTNVHFFFRFTFSVYIYKHYMSETLDHYTVYRVYSFAAKSKYSEFNICELVYTNDASSNHSNDQVFDCHFFSRLVCSNRLGEMFVRWISRVNENINIMVYKSVQTKSALKLFWIINVDSKCGLEWGNYRGK